MKDLKDLLLFCDPEIIDEKNTTAELCVGKFDSVKDVFTLDKPWEGDSSGYYNFFKDGDVYRMYYLARKTGNPNSKIKVAYAESKNGIDWVRPSLGIRQFDGNGNNNILLDENDRAEGDWFDNFFVFKDTNPDCKKSERYKALAYTNLYKLMCFFSEDGLHFVPGPVFDMPGHFDTLNTCFYDEKQKKYVAFVRSFHDVPENGDLNLGKRDVRRTVSDDFRNWSLPELLDFGTFDENNVDFPLYTNNVSPYPEGKYYYMGFPTRYIERYEWTDNFEKLTGKEARIDRMENDARRSGLTVTDCIFMVSSDTKKWKKFDEAIISPGLENGFNWVYGDGYPAYGVIPFENEYGFLIPRNQWFPDKPSILRLIKIRKDGFAFYQAPYSGRKVTLKPMTLTSNEIFINFSTSAAGSITVSVKDEQGNELTSCETFGDSIRREISIDKEALKAFVNKKVTITITMKDAKIYSLFVK